MKARRLLFPFRELPELAGAIAYHNVIRPELPSMLSMLRRYNPEVSPQSKARNSAGGSPPVDTLRAQARTRGTWRLADRG